MKNHYYILDENGDPQMVEELLEWATWFESSGEKRRIALTQVGRFSVSTVFLALNHAFDDGIPLLYETMIFDMDNNPYDFEDLTPSQRASLEVLDFDIFGWCRRYATKTGALEGHEEVVEKLKRVLTENENN